MNRFLTVILAFAAVLFVVSCGDDGTKEPAMGSKGGECYGNGTCDGDLVCLSNVCVDPTETPDKDTVVNDTTASCDYAVMDDSNAGGEGCGSGGAMAVGSKPNGVSPYGAYDMIGNVHEWVSDWYGYTYYETSPTNNPAGPETGVYRVLRGGSWNLGNDLRASSRVGSLPDSYAGIFGFRCAK